MILQLTESSPPQVFIEPFTVDEAKVFLKVTNDAENSLIGVMIQAAREIAEIHQGVDLIPKQYDLYLDGFPGYDYSLNTPGWMYSSTGGLRLRTPLRSVDLIQYTDSTGAATALTAGVGADYLVDAARGLVTLPYGRSWPSFTPQPSSAVLIRFTSGYALTSPFWQDAGARVKVGMQLLIGGWHANRVPFDPSLGPGQEYPFSATPLLSWGARQKVY